MDSGRIFRFVVMFLTLMGVLWAIREITGRQHAVPTEVQPTAVKAVLHEVTDPASYTLPLVAFENSCEDGQATDISRCTGKLSRSEGRSYRLELEHAQPVVIVVKPLDELFDPSFALLDEFGSCLLGMDEQGEATAERGELRELAAGRYELIVSGYGDQCGPYQLTVREPLPLLTKVTAPRVVRGANGVSVQWETFGEHEVTHFKVYRDTEAGRALVKTIRSHGSPAGAARYRWVDRTPKTGLHYELEAVAADGRRESLGSVAS